MGLTIEKLAGRTLYNKKNPGDEASRKEEVFVDPGSIIMYISILNGLVKLLKQCNKEPHEVAMVAYNIKKPNTTQEYRQLKRLVRREVGWIKWFWEGSKIMDAVIETGINSDVEEIQAVYQET